MPPTNKISKNKKKVRKPQGHVLSQYLYLERKLCTLALNISAHIHLVKRQHETGVDLTVFHEFLELPLEIQAMTWKWACTFPRVVEFLLAPNRYNRAPSITPVPALLHTCSFARQEGRKMYTKLPGYGVTKSWSTYVDWDIDSIFLEPADVHAPDTYEFHKYITSKNYTPTALLLQNCKHLVSHARGLFGRALSGFHDTFKELISCTIVRYSETHNTSVMIRESPSLVDSPDAHHVLSCLDTLRKKKPRIESKAWPNRRVGQ
jgi:hypothetical protein